MTKPNWTPGPWIAHSSIARGEFWVRSTVSITTICEGLTQENARLIAQAPAMAELLDQVVENYPLSEDISILARAILAKIEAND